MLEDFKTMPLDYPLVREPKDVPIGLDSDFWDVPELITTLLGLPWYF